MVRNRFAILLGVLFVASGAFAQQNDVAVSFGGTFTDTCRLAGLVNPCSL
jgi:hypothetical protein